MARFSTAQNFHILILGEGITSRSERRGDADETGLKKLQAQARAVGALLGAKSVHFCELPDNRFDELALLDVIKQVEYWVKELQPEIIYTHHPGDLNIDHSITFRAVLTAARSVQSCPVREIYAYEVPSSTEWAFGQFDPAFQPNVFVDISTTLERKVEAMRLYAHEIRPFPHPRSPEALEAIARRWGSVAGLDAAEAFVAVRIMR